MTPCTETAARVLAFIRRVQEKRGYPPSFRAILRGTHQSSYGGLHKQIAYLMQEGYLAPRANCRQPYRFLRETELPRCSTELSQARLPRSAPK